MSNKENDQNIYNVDLGSDSDSSSEDNFDDIPVFLNSGILDEIRVFLNLSVSDDPSTEMNPMADERSVLQPKTDFLNLIDVSNFNQIWTLIL